MRQPVPEERHVELIAQRIEVAYQRYGAAPIRDFVPLLVERELTAELRADTADDE